MTASIPLRQAPVLNPGPTPYSTQLPAGLSQAITMYTAGDTVFVLASAATYAGEHTSWTVTDTLGNTYAQIAALAGPTGNLDTSQELRLYCAQNVQGGAAVVTSRPVGGDLDSQALAIVELVGAWSVLGASGNSQGPLAATANAINSGAGISVPAANVAWLLGFATNISELSQTGNYTPQSGDRMTPVAFGWPYPGTNPQALNNLNISAQLCDHVSAAYQTLFTPAVAGEYWQTIAVAVAPAAPAAGIPLPLTAAQVTALSAGTAVTLTTTAAVPAGGTIIVTPPAASTAPPAGTTPTGAVTGWPAVAKPAVASPGLPALNVMPLAPPAGMAVWKAGPGYMVDQNGDYLDCRGVVYSGLENTAMQNWDGANYWGDSGFPGMPPLAVLSTWSKGKANVVRLPYNDAGVLALNCVDGEGKTVYPGDPVGGGAYLADLDAAIVALTAAGKYWILDAHWSAPWLLTIPGYANGAFLAPLGQGPFMNTRTSPAALKLLAKRYSLFTNGAIEAFNEPMLEDAGGPCVPAGILAVMLAGGTCGAFTNNSDGGADFTLKETWGVYGWQQAVTDIRAAGFTGPIFLGSPGWSGDLSGFLTAVPVDPLKQLVAVWHAYPAPGTTFGTPAYALPGLGAANSVSPVTGVKGTAFAWAQAIQAAGYPVFATEYGGQNTAGTVGEPFTTAITAFFAANKIGSTAWAFMVAGDAANILLADITGTPTPGYGLVAQAYVQARAA